VIKVNLKKGNESKSSPQLIPKKVLVRGKDGSYYAIRYVRSGSEEDGGKQNLSSIPNVKIKDLLILIGESKLNQKQLHELVSHEDEYVRERVARKINQSGLHQMINDDDDDVRKRVAERINQAGLQLIMNDEHRYIREIAIKRNDLINNIKFTIDSYDKNKEIELSKYMKNELKDIIKKDTRSVSMMKCTDEFYGNVDNGKFIDFHIESKNEWIWSSFSDLALLLKDSIKRQFGCEIRHYYDINDYDEKVNELYKVYNRKDVDEYVKMQKDLTRKYLDEMFPDTDIITLYRGTHKDEIEDLNDEDKKVIVKSNPLSSWTLEKYIAKGFGETGVVLTTKVHKDDIWSTFMSHAYDGDAREIIVIGNKDREVDVI